MSDRNSTQPRVAVYFRMSRDVQDKSIARQQSEVMPHCQRQGYRVVAEHQDEGISGSEVKRRPGLQRLLALAKSRQIDGVVVDDLDRLARLDLLELGVLLSPLREAGVWVESCAQGRMDYNTMAGRIMLGIGGEAKRGEQLATARRVLTSHLERARDRRQPPQTKTAYGYRREPIPGTTLKAPPVIDEVAAEHVRSIFRWYVEGHSVGWIIRELYNRGVPSPRGRPRWSRPVVRELLRNPIYVGRRAWGKASVGRFFRQCGGVIRPGTGNRKYIRNQPDEWFSTDDTPALVDADVWDAVQRRLARRAPRTPTVEPDAFLLSALLVCGRCGAPMTGVRKMRRNNRSRRGPIYVCQGYVEHSTAVCVRAVAEEGWAVRQIIAELRDRLLLPERLEWLTKRLAEQAREQRGQDNLKHLGKAVERLNARLARERSRLMEVSKDMIPEAEAAIRATRAELEAAEKALREAQTADPVRDLKITAEAARKALWSLETALEGENRCLLKEALRDILAGVVIGAEPYQTTTGKTWHRARIDGIRLRPGSGLDVLSDLERTAEASSGAPWRGQPPWALSNRPPLHSRTGPRARPS
jgi:DNA invertase Pin-like site-specific DNA recombinase